MIVMVILIAGAALYFELRLVRSVPELRRIFERNPLISLAGSLVISLALGTVFGAAGVVVFVAGILSTMFAQPIWASRRWWEAIRSRHGMATARRDINDIALARGDDVAAIRSLTSILLLAFMRVVLRAISFTIMMLGFLARSTMSMVHRYMGLRRSPGA